MKVCFEPNNQMVKCDPRKGRVGNFLGAELLYEIINHFVRMCVCMYECKLFLNDIFCNLYILQIYLENIKSYRLKNKIIFYNLMPPA